VRSFTTHTEMDAMMALQLAWIFWRRNVTFPCQKLNIGPLDSLNLGSVKSHLSHFLMKMCTTLYMKCIRGGERQPQWKIFYMNERTTRKYYTYMEITLPIVTALHHT